MNTEIYDYRNGKYQGAISPHKLRQGLGVFIDDDLAFYVSQWADSKLAGPTLVYLAHGKYIYGEWVANQPHGLNVFRCGDTVLVGQFIRGTPAGRCLLIFEKHNFACILGERNGRWDIVDSGQLLNHRSLLGYLQFLDMPVPDHFFSLTKFACHFSNTSHLRTYPTANNCCYFGFPVGLGIVFNANNGVVSVGLHRNEELCEFGGKFDNSRQSEQGNFEQGGERIAFLGERPTSKIHAIFQKLHKRSLNFFNEYIDSRSKIFNSIETLVKGKLRDIGETCRQEGQAVDLNDSLDYQDYGEEESLKINENREKMYSPPKKSMISRTPKREEAKREEGKATATTGNFFRKNTESKKKEEFGTRKEEEKAVYVVQRSPHKFERKDSQADLQRNQPERTDRSPAIPSSANKAVRGISSKAASTTNLLQLAESTETDVRQTFKMKQKMRANNLRYLAPSNPTPTPEPVDKPVFRDMRREGSSSTLRKEEQPTKLEYRVIKAQEEYRVPTFKGLVEEYELSRQKSGKFEDKLEETSTFKNLKASISEEESYVLPERKSRQAQLPNFNEIQLTPKRLDRAEKGERGERGERVERPERVQRVERTERPERVQRVERGERGDKVQRGEMQERADRLQRQQVQQKPSRRHQLIEPQRPLQQEQLPTTSTEKRKRSVEIKALARPSYEDIEQRRKRILKSFQELNTQTPTPPTNPTNPSSPCHAVTVSGARDEPIDFGYIPLSISNKMNHKTPIKRPTDKEKPQEMGKGVENDRFKYQQRESGFSYGQGSELMKKIEGRKENRDTAVKEDSRESGMLRRAPSYGYMNAMASSKGEEIQGQTPSRTVPTSMQSSIGTTPTRPKRCYQYVYE